MARTPWVGLVRLMKKMTGSTRRLIPTTRLDGLNGRSPLTRPSATLSPSDGERDGVRGFLPFYHLSPVVGITPRSGEREFAGNIRSGREAIPEMDHLGSCGRPKRKSAANSLSPLRRKRPGGREASWTAPVLRRFWRPPQSGAAARPSFRLFRLREPLLVHQRSIRPHR